MWQQRWIWYAIGSAVAAAIIPVLGKAGLKGVDPGAATMLRSISATVALAIIATAMGVWDKTHTLWRTESGSGRALIALALTGVAGAVSWLFYFKALALADATKVAPIDKLSVPIGVLLAVVVLGERPTGLNWVGLGLVVVGAFLAALPSRAGT